MKRVIALTILAFLSQSGFAQFQSYSRPVKFDLPQIQSPSSEQLNKKSPSNPQVCGQDTVRNGYYKAVFGSVKLSWVSISKGYSLGQYYDAPDSLTVSGFRFFASRAKNDTLTTAVFCHLYAASSDSLPTGSPLRSDTINVGYISGTDLDSFEFSANWAPYKVSHNLPYIIVVSSNDTDRVGIITNDFASGDGLRQNLACGSVGGTWYNALNLNVSGVTLDCDILLEPYVKYNLYNDFTFKDCFATFDSVHFINKSSDIFNSMYNRYTIYSDVRFNHRWDYGYGFYQYGPSENGAAVYTSYQNRNVSMVSTLYQYGDFLRCTDTTVKEVHFQPAPIKLTGIPTTICTGDSFRIQTGSNGVVKWFDEPFDTTPFYIGTYYDTPPLFSDRTDYVRAFNAGCSSIVARLELKVNEKPTVTSTLNDSICSNSLANLAAYSDIGTIRWFADSNASVFVKDGNVLQVGPLQSDTAFYAQAFNSGCVSDNNVKVSALVSNDFAPTTPLTSGDTTICLLSGNIQLNATASDTVRWFNVPSGGVPVHTGGSYLFKPTKPGTETIFVDAFNGTCASSRLGIKVKVDHFETVSDQFQETCFGNTLIADFSDLKGGLRWYDTDTNFVLDNTALIVSEPGTYRYFIQPYMGDCRDTGLHSVILVIHPLPVINVAENDGACRGTEGIVMLQDNGADFEWFYDAEPVGTGLTITTPKLFLNRTYQVKATKNGCESDTSITVLVLKTPNANFDYQISWRNVQFEARDLTLASYLWDMDDNGKTYTVPQFTHYFATDGDYKISLVATGENGCRDTISKPVTINTVSVEDKTYGHRVWPNPSVSTVNIELPGVYADLNIRVLDMAGRLIMDDILPDQANARVDLSALNAGTYLIQIRVDMEVYHVKVVKY